MATDVASDRAAALQLIAGGKISGAIDLLGRLAESLDDPEDRFLLGKIAYLATDFDQALAQLERAYGDFQARGQPRRAAMVATWLAQIHFDSLDQKVVGRAWLARASRLLEHDENCVEQGYVLVGLFGIAVESADELEANARAALEIAHRFQDRNLECKALGDSGLALVSMGRIRDGMARLDEAFAMIIGGECGEPSVISQVVCGLISACERCGDLMRAQEWLRFVESTTPLEGEGRSIHTYARCWSALGSLLCHAGRWQEAEIALPMALARGERSYHDLKLASRAALADLWICQGRIDEAARLIDQSIDRVEVMGPRARLHLAQGSGRTSGPGARSLRRQGA